MQNPMELGCWILTVLFRKENSILGLDLSTKTKIRSISCWLYYYFTPSRDFHTSVSCWSSTRVWATASLLRSPGFFSIFWPISTMLYFLFSSPPVLLSILRSLYRKSQLKLVFESPSCSIVFFLSNLKRSRFLSFSSISFSFTIRQVLFFVDYF